MTERQVMIVEDIDGLRDALTRTATEVLGVDDVASLSTLADARAWLREARRPTIPLIALLDLGLPDGSGDTLIPALAEDPLATVIVLTIFEDDGNVTRSLAAGAHGYLLKTEAMEVIADRLRGMERGEVALSPPIARRLMNRFREVEPRELPGQEPLTPRETEVLHIIGRGLTISEAAGTLGIGVNTVSTHVKSIYRKLSIASRAEAAMEAARRGLI